MTDQHPPNLKNSIEWLRRKAALEEGHAVEAGGSLPKHPPIPVVAWDGEDQDMRGWTPVPGKELDALYTRLEAAEAKVEQQAKENIRLTHDAENAQDWSIEYRKQLKAAEATVQQQAATIRTLREAIRGVEYEIQSRADHHRLRMAEYPSESKWRARVIEAFELDKQLVHDRLAALAQPPAPTPTPETKG